MEIAVVVLSGLAVLLALGLVWAVRGRAGLEAELRSASDRAGRAEADGEGLSRTLDEARGEVSSARARADESSARVLELSEALATARSQLEESARRLDEAGRVEERLKDTFRALSAETLKDSRAAFLEQAKPVFESAKKEQADLVRPIGETLEATRVKLETIEKARAESQGKITEQIAAMTGANSRLTEETARLAKALSRPEVRGQYGEIQLRRVAELAGMTSYCDFSEQYSQRDGEGNLQRPDMVVTLPNDRVIVVDAKANINAYIDAVNAPSDEEREAQLQRFARHTAEQVKKLSDKRYWSMFDGKSAEFVVMFVPGDHFIDAALSRRPDLLDIAAQLNVILASPSTLIGLLRAVAVGWREHALTEQAEELFELGRELHDRAATAFGHAESLGKAIRASVERYNKLVGSIDTRMVPTLRKFEEAGAKSAKALVEPKALEATPRGLESADAE